MKLRQQIGAKARISATMRNWLPLLQCPITDLEAKLKLESDANPFLEINAAHELSYEDHDPCEEESADEMDFRGEEDDYYRRTEPKNSVTDAIEATTLHSGSLYDALYDQITDHLFPTPRSQAIAYAIIEQIDNEGFFEGDIEAIATACESTPAQVESIRRRFEQLSPAGVGAKDLAECFSFQLREYDVDEALYGLLKTLIEDMDNLHNHHKAPRFSEAMGIFKRFKNPPAVEFMADSDQVVPDLFVFDEGDRLEVRINDAYYPELSLEEIPGLPKEEFIRAKLKEARDLIDAVNMRKATLYKIGLMIVEYQYDFFKGDEIRPMKLADISEDLGRNASTISRAISGKYLACDRGVFPLKSFFSISIDDTSTRAIKDYLQKLIKDEPREKPLSDQKLLLAIQEHFEIKMVRRTITKYREQLDIPTSGERKRLYLLG
jgi:RNA polymerase sigma-54 factor